MKRSLYICASIAVIMLSSTAATASKCDDHGVLRDMEHYTSMWGGRSERPMIHLWDSPFHVAVVGKVNPGAYVVILEERDGYYRIRTPEGVTGWIRKEQVASKLPREEVQPYECLG